MTKTNPTTVKLPTTTDELRDVIRLGIERYMGSPAKKKDKLNESLAAGLGFSHYDALAPLLINEEKNNKYKVKISDNDVFINDVKIKSVVFSDEQSHYDLKNTKQRIFEINRMLTEAENNLNSPLKKNIPFYKESLNYLLSIDDKYFWESIYDGTDLVAKSKSPLEFDEICEEVLELHEDAKKDLEKIANLIANDYEKYDVVDHDEDKIEIYSVDIDNKEKELIIHFNFNDNLSSSSYEICLTNSSLIKYPDFFIIEFREKHTPNHLFFLKFSKK